jgi:hypothetical protein
VRNGHEHLYERFVPQTPNAVADPQRGIRQFTVGTDGGALFSFSSTIQPNSERRNNTSYGVLKLTLKSGSYTQVIGYWYWLSVIRTPGMLISLERHPESSNNQ